MEPEAARLERLRKEMTQGLWWLDFVKFWGDLARAISLRYAMDTLTLQWASMKREFKVKGRPKGSPNKAKAAVESLGEEAL